MALSVYKKAETEVYEGMKDEIIVEIARSGDSVAADYLVRKYRDFVGAKSRSYFLIGADRDDIVQEGMIGLYKAIRDFNFDKGVSFRMFAELCITRQVITAIKTATRQKHIPLNSYISLNKPVYDDESDKTLIDIVEGIKITDPQDLIISKEEVKKIETKIREVLSGLELEILKLYVGGRSYDEISNLSGRDYKSIDNALQRVKKKLERCLELEMS